MKTFENIAVRIMVGTGSMAVLCVALLAGVAVCVLNGLLSVRHYGLISVIIHFVSVYLGSMICCGLVKEKKGICAGISTAAWYIVLLFISLVLLECSAGNVVGSAVAGACGYGVALVSSALAKRKGKGQIRKFRSR